MRDVPVQVHLVLCDHIFWSALVLHSEFFCDELVFFFHMYLLNNRFVKFYSSDIVDGHYTVKVDEITSVVVDDNPWWHWLLPANANCVLNHF